MIDEQLLCDGSYEFCSFPEDNVIETPLPPRENAIETSLPPEDNVIETPPDQLEDLSHPSQKYRKIAGEGLRKQAEKMRKRSKKVLKPAAVGDCMGVFVSEFDRGKADPANVIGVVMAVDEHHRFTIGTKVGIIDNRIERTGFELTKYQALKFEAVPSTKLSLREIVRLLSVGKGQGYKRYGCKTGCDTKRCKCLQENLKCNSACHKGNINCKNHE